MRNARNNKKGIQDYTVLNLFTISWNRIYLSSVPKHAGLKDHKTSLMCILAVTFIHIFVALINVLREFKTALLQFSGKHCFGTVLIK